MKLTWFRLLSALNKVALPKIYRMLSLERLSVLDRAVVGWKMWVTYRRLDAESAHQVAVAESNATAPAKA